MTVSPSPTTRHEKIMKHAAAARGTAVDAAATRRRRPMFLVLLAACALMLVAGVTLKHGRSRSEPASIVRERVVSMVLDGAWLGGLFVHADHVDLATGELVQFRATADTVLLTADRARPIINAEDSTLSFDLTGVVLVGANDEVDDGAGSMVTLASHRLGPFPLSIRVKADPPRMDATELQREFAEVPTDLPLR